jgi:hypothetical protein
MGVLPSGSQEGIGDAREMFRDASYRGARQMLMPLKDRSLDTMLNREQASQHAQGNETTAANMGRANTTANVASVASTILPQKNLGTAGYAPSVFSRAAWQAPGAAAAAPVAAPAATGALSSISNAGKSVAPTALYGGAIGVADQNDRNQMAMRGAPAGVPMPADVHGSMSLEQAQALAPHSWADAHGLMQLVSQPNEQAQPAPATDPGQQLEQLLGQSEDPQAQAAQQGYSLGPDHPQSQPTIPVREQMDIEAQQAASQPPTAEAIKQLPPEQQPEAAKAFVSTAKSQYAQSKMPDATPEQQEAALQEKAQRIAGGQPQPEDVEEGVTTLAEEHQADLSQPNVLSQMFEMWQSLPPPMQYGLAIGVPLAIMGMVTAAFGDTGLGALLGIAGIGAAGAGWALGGMPGLPQGSSQVAAPDPVKPGQDGSRYAANTPQAQSPTPAAPAAADPLAELAKQHGWMNDWADKGTGPGAVPGQLDPTDAQAAISAWVTGQSGAPSSEQLQAALASAPPELKAQVRQQVQNHGTLGWFYPQQKQQLLSWLS